MAWPDAALLVLLCLVAIGLVTLTYVEERRRDPPLPFRKTLSAGMSILYGAAFVFAGSFLAESPNVETFMVSMGASVLGAGLVFTLVPWD